MRFMTLARPRLLARLSIGASLMLSLLGGASSVSAQPTPADTLVGRSTTMCSYGVPIQLQVARAEWTKSVIGANAPGNGMWVVAIVDVTNQGQSDEGLYTFAKLKDERGRDFKWAQYPPDPIDLAAAYQVKGTYERFTPGVTEQSVIAFLVAGDVKTLSIEADSLDPAACPATTTTGPATSAGAPDGQSTPPNTAPTQPANPAETLVGQSTIICSYGVRIELRVARTEWTKTVLNNTAPGNGMWVVAIVDVTNQGTKQEGLYTFAKLKDERGREFNWAQYPPDPIDLAAAYAVKGSFQNFAPGITEQSVITFVVPSDVRSLTILHNSLDPASCG
jgi:hypothetical protein